MIYYFAYGSNMNLKLLKKLKVAVLKNKTGYLRHYTIAFNRYDKDNPHIAYANIKKSTNRRVWGRLLKIFKRDLKKLDRWEEYPDSYRRIKLPVTTKNSQTEAIVYIAFVKEHFISRPAKNYLKLILEASKQLPKNYRFTLKQTATADINWSIEDAL